MDHRARYAVIIGDGGLAAAAHGGCTNGETHGPCYPERVSEGSTRAAAVDVADKSPLVLVVDDDADIRAAIAETLDDEGYRVAQAANGMAALDFLRRGASPALILLDLWMPVLDGWGFLERRETDASLAAVPVIVMSASPFERHVPGVQRLLKKPIRFEVLLDAVAAAVEPATPSRSPSVAPSPRTRQA